METFKLHIAFNDDQKARMNEVAQLRKKAKTIEDALRVEVYNHKEASIAERLTDYRKRPTVTMNANGAAIEFEPKAVEKTPAPPSVTPQNRTVHMDPKVLNSLLNGRLLTDDQKRKLVGRVHPELNGIVYPEGEEMAEAPSDG